MESSRLLLTGTIEHRLRQTIGLRVAANHMRRQEYKQLGFTGLAAGVTKQPADQGNRAKKRYAASTNVPLRVGKTAKGNGLPVLDKELSLHRSSRDHRRIEGNLGGRAIHLLRHFEHHTAISANGWPNHEARANIPVLHDLIAGCGIGR